MSPMRPCSWGVIENVAGDTAGYRRVLDEMAETGYVGTELGDWGFMPTDPAELRQRARCPRPRDGRPPSSTPWLQDRRPPRAQRGRSGSHRAAAGGRRRAGYARRAGQRSLRRPAARARWPGASRAEHGMSDDPMESVHRRRRTPGPPRSRRGRDPDRHSPAPRHPGRSPMDEVPAIPRRDRPGSVGRVPRHRALDVRDRRRPGRRPSANWASGSGTSISRTALPTSMAESRRAGMGRPHVDRARRVLRARQRSRGFPAVSCARSRHRVRRLDRGGAGHAAWHGRPARERSSQPRLPPVHRSLTQRCPRPA